MDRALKTFCDNISQEEAEDEDVEPGFANFRHGQGCEGNPFFCLRCYIIDLQGLLEIDVRSMNCSYDLTDICLSFIKHKC